MAWTETTSLSFTARHEAGESDEILAVLEALEDHRTRLERLFPTVPEGVTVIFHDSPLQLGLAQPYLPVARMFASASGRRYMTGWFGRDEVHVLAPEALRRRVGGQGSLEALMLSPLRVYTLLVVGSNNPFLPPPFRPSAFARLVRLGWVAEGAAQYFSGQLPHLRPAFARRLREGAVRFPPGPRDAALLGGVLFDVLARERGEAACVALACGAGGEDARHALESAFAAGSVDVAYSCRRRLEEMAGVEPAAAS